MTTLPKLYKVCDHTVELLGLFTFCTAESQYMQQQTTELNRNCLKSP